MKQTNVPTFSRSFIAIALLFSSTIFAGIVSVLTLILKKNPYISLFLLVLTIIGSTIFVLQYWGGMRRQIFRKLGRFILIASLTALVVFFLVGCASQSQVNPKTEAIRKVISDKCSKNDDCAVLSEVKAVPESDRKALEASYKKCADPNEKIEVYPANDGMGGSLSSSSSIKPVVYCNKEELFKKRKKLWVEELKPEVPPPAKQ